MKIKEFSREERAVIEQGPTPEGFRLFRKTIYQNYRVNGRDLPWRKTKDPYRIFVSEMMLQQTQVDRVLGKYEKFVGVFPGFSTLASAPLKDILGVWQGLGYNRRAVAIKNTAEKVVTEYGGAMPTRLEDLIALPGIGHATASAVITFACNRPVAFIETNIRRVFIHFFFQESDGVDDSDILPLVEKSLDAKNPREWYYALMDYGAMLSRRIPNPNVKSTHYRRQPPFEGSRRQLRGRVLMLLLDGPDVTEREMASRAKAEIDKVRDCLRRLEKEGFIRKKGRRYSIV